MRMLGGPTNGQGTHLAIGGGTGTSVIPDCHRRTELRLSRISCLMGAVWAGLALDHLAEHAADLDVAAHSPHAVHYLGCPLLLMRLVLGPAFVSRQLGSGGLGRSPSRNPAREFQNGFSTARGQFPKALT
jgi:hypothetical protein